MPVLWQASQRPMFVHTVTVDGFRHAILTNDDPYIAKLKQRSRPRYSASATQYAGYSGKIFYNLRQESRRLNRIIENDKYNIDKLNLNELDQESEHSYVLKAASQQLYNYDSNRSSYNSLGLNMKAFRSIRKTRSEKPQSDVSMRVSQWLDLAGKIDSSPEKVTKIVQSRYSWPTIQRHNLSISNTEVDLKEEKEAKAPNDSARKQIGIDQRDFPPFVTTVQNYARQSRYKIATRDSGKKTAKRDVRGNVLKARQKMEPVRSPAETQCAGLISVKEIKPDLREAKKQVNILLPGAIRAISMTKRLEKLLSDLNN